MRGEGEMSCFVSVYDGSGSRIAYWESRSSHGIARIRFEDEDGEVHNVEPAQAVAITSLRSQISNLQAELDRAKAELAATQVRLAKAYDRLNFDDCKLSDKERPIYVVTNLDGCCHIPFVDANGAARETVNSIMKKGGSSAKLSIYKKVGTFSATSHVETKWEDA